MTADEPTNKSWMGKWIYMNKYLIYIFFVYIFMYKKYIYYRNDLRIVTMVDF